METNLEEPSENVAEMSIKEWSLFIFSYISVVIPLTFVTGVLFAIILAITSKLFNAPVIFESYFILLWGAWAYLLEIGSYLVTGMFVYCMVAYSA